MLLGTVAGVKIYAFKGSVETPDKFFVTKMNSLFVRQGTKAYYDIRKALNY